jgi:hypothetical protein
VAPRRAPGLFADHDAATRTLGFEPSADVERVADKVGVTDADHHLAGVHRDAQCEFHPVLFGDPGGEVDEAFLQLDRRVHGAHRILGPDFGDTPHGHESVTDVLRHTGAVALRYQPQQVVIAADDLTCRLGVDALLEARRAGQIGEHDSDRLAHRTHIGCVRLRLRLERCPAPAAEARGRTGFHTTRRTDPRKRCAATLAEAGVLFVRRPAGGASAAALGHRQSGLSANASWSSIAVAAPLNMVRSSANWRSLAMSIWPAPMTG